MSNWVVEVEPDAVVDGEIYFLACRRPTPQAPYRFWCSNDAGKEMWATKPGIARRYRGSDALREYLRGSPDVVAIKVPADADKRWKARRIRRKRER